MGFKCPICLKDFGREKDQWKEHCETEHLGAGQDVVDMVTRVVDMVTRVADNPNANMSLEGDKL